MLYKVWLSFTKLRILVYLFYITKKNCDNTADTTICFFLCRYVFITFHVKLDSHLNQLLLMHHYSQKTLA